jgi:YD repeat-containing protein
MKIIPLLAVASVFCFLTACKKSGGSNSSSNSNRVKTYVEALHGTSFDQTDTFNLSYDNNGRLISMISTTGQQKYSYAYTGNTSFTLDLLENGEPSIHENFFVNSSLLVDSTFQYDNTQDTTTERYNYNGSQLTTLLTYDYSNGVSSISTRDTYTYDNNGNGIKDVQDDGFGTINTTTTFTYTNKPTQVTTNPTYLPVASKDLPATQVVTDGSGNVQANVTYAYVFDSAGRVIQVTSTDVSGIYSVKTYTYY